MGRPRGEATTVFAKYLAEHDISDGDAAKKLDITPAFVGMLRRGKAGPSLALANRIAEWTDNHVPTGCWVALCP